jgi:hypothetical protein
MLLWLSFSAEGVHHALFWKANQKVHASFIVVQLGLFKRKNMKYSNRLVCLAAMSMLLGSAYAKDVQSMRPLEAALQSEEAKKKLDPKFKIVFGKQAHPKVEKSLGETAMKRSTTQSASDDFDPCVHAFVRAMLDFQERTRAAGGNAVVNVRSNYKNNEVSSETEYTCVSGSLVTAVAFKGEMVKLAE